MLLPVAIISATYFAGRDEMLWAQTNTSTPQSPTSSSASKLSSVDQSSTATQKRYSSTTHSRRAQLYYDSIWGVDSLQVKYAESGEMIRFSYRVLDAEKAKTLNDKKNDPSLIDPRAGVRLSVPSLEKVGKLRQSTTPEAGKAYWMAFSNKGRLVKPGDRVNIVIGKFQANGLVVQ